ncbi:MAG: integrase core domain-containing protein, partial [Clostridia bacterium]|nr:integrase core domain-containing protein [Clostridia bacterium]
MKLRRWFRSLKCECIYINEFETPRALRRGIAAYIQEYNHGRPHSAHDDDY